MSVYDIATKLEEKAAECDRQARGIEVDHIDLTGSGDAVARLFGKAHAYRDAAVMIRTYMMEDK